MTVGQYLALKERLATFAAVGGVSVWLGNTLRDLAMRDVGAYELLDLFSSAGGEEERNTIVADLLEAVCRDRDETFSQILQRNEEDLFFSGEYR